MIATGAGSNEGFMRRLVGYGSAAVTLALVVGAIGWGGGGALLGIQAGGPRAAGGAGSPRGGAGAGGPDADGSGGGGGSAAGPTATPTPPTGGTELYGYLPYWEMTDAMAAYLPQVPVKTLALFSVTATLNGGIKHSDIGYERITGSRGLSLIADAHLRGQRVELVFTSFGYTANARLFGSDAKALARRARVARELAALAQSLGVDGVNVDVELIDGDLNDGYVALLADLGSRLRATNPHATVTVASTAGHAGADRARAAVAAGVDRVFLMGYDIHWSGSNPGASSPINNRDGTIDLRSAIAGYVNAGVPRDRILLGLPLYGMTWPVTGPGRGALAIGNGSTFIPSQHLGQLLAPGFTSYLDLQEFADWFATLNGSTWNATYYDSPRSLQPKLELARSQGLAGAGFWALGYERGLPGYTDLMANFVAGNVGG
jgi:spore germination protein